MTMNTDFKVAEVQLSYRNTVPYKKRTQITNAKEAYKVLLKIHNDDTIDILKCADCLIQQDCRISCRCLTLSIHRAGFVDEDAYRDPIGLYLSFSHVDCRYSLEGFSYLACVEHSAAHSLVDELVLHR